MYDLPRQAVGSRERQLCDLPQAGLIVGVLSPDIEELRLVPQGAVRPLLGIVQLVPYRKQAVRERGLHAPGRVGDVYELPRQTGRTLLGQLHDMPQTGRVLGLLPPDLDELRVMSLGAIEPLRHQLRLVPLALEVVGQRDVQSPVGTRRRAHVQELRVHQLPPERLLLAELHLVS